MRVSSKNFKGHPADDISGLLDISREEARSLLKQSGFEVYEEVDLPYYKVVWVPTSSESGKMMFIYPTDAAESDQIDSVVEKALGALSRRLPGKYETSSNFYGFSLQYFPYGLSSSEYEKEYNLQFEKFPEIFMATKEGSLNHVNVRDGKRTEIPMGNLYDALFLVVLPSREIAAAVDKTETYAGYLFKNNILVSKVG